MSSFGITFEYMVGSYREPGTTGLQRMRVAFERAGDEVKDFGSHVFPDIVKALEKESRRQFVDRGHGPNVGAWRALSTNYAKWKHKHYPSKKLLEREGNLREALTRSSSSFAERFIGVSLLEFGTRSVPYASFHQTGTRRMPSRPVFDFGADFEQDLFDATRKGVAKAMRAARLADVAEVRE